jgi:hypothetical protein
MSCLEVEARLNLPRTPIHITTLFLHLLLTNTHSYATVHDGQPVERSSSYPH